MNHPADDTQSPDDVSTRQRILAATAEVLGRSGQTKLSLSEVALQAGVSRPTFYKYFASLEEAVEQLVTRVNQDIIDRLMVAIASAPDPVGKIEAAILGMLNQ